MWCRHLQALSWQRTMHPVPARSVKLSVTAEHCRRMLMDANGIAWAQGPTGQRQAAARASIALHTHTRQQAAPLRSAAAATMPTLGPTGAPANPAARAPTKTLRALLRVRRAQPTRTRRRAAARRLRANVMQASHPARTARAWRANPATLSPLAPTGPVCPARTTLTPPPPVRRVPATQGGSTRVTPLMMSVTRR